MANRIEMLLQPRFQAAPVFASQAVYSSDAASGCTVFAPLHYEPNYAYPLLVWLHGPGGDEHQLKKIMPLVSLRNYVAVGPRGTLMSDRKNERPTYGWRQSSGHVPLAQQRVMEAIQRAQEKFHIAPSRIFLAGYDAGGTMALRIALEHPERFAGAISIGGGLPAGCNPLARLHAARQLPVFVACGRHSQRFPENQACENLKLLHVAGISVTLRQYPCGDEITMQMLSDMDRWIMEQIFPPEPALPRQSQHRRGEWD